MPRRTDMPARVRALREFLARERRMPGYNEMLTLFGYRSKNAVHGLLRRMRDAGYVTVSSGKVAPTGTLLGGVRLLGAVQAGFPSPAEEELVDTLSMDEFLIRRPEATFMLTVTGDSMLDAGIHPGDLVLVERGATPRTNDIVVAQVDGEWTLKYFVKDSGGIRLEPANKAYKTIRPRETFSIGGVVRTVIRKYT
jgi:SOS regulatory protein LexA